MGTERPPIEPFRLLFVCSGNTCRSPLAEVITRRAVSRLGWIHLEVGSAGVDALEGTPASEGSLSVAARHGLDLVEHRSTRLTPARLERADLVLAMSPSHVLHLAEMGAAEKAALLTSFAGADEPDTVPGSVPDPFGGDEAEYEETFVLLERLIDQALRRLAPILAP